MGPWWHGGWARGSGLRYQDIYFEQPTSVHYRETIELPFFNHYLKDGPDPELPEASIFVSGSNQWHAFDKWPPAEAKAASLYLAPDGGLSFDAPTGTDDFDEYVSDPAKPVPHTSQVVINRDDRYLIQDQRFASSRTDVLVFESEVLPEDRTVTGDLFAHLYVSTTGEDADFIVKLIDVYPDTASYAGENQMNVKMGGFQLMVRGGGHAGPLPEQFHPSGTNGAGGTHEGRLRHAGRGPHVRGGAPHDGPGTEHLVPHGRPQSSDLGTEYLRSEGGGLPGGDPPGVLLPERAFPPEIEAAGITAFGLDEVEPVPGQLNGENTFQRGPERTGRNRLEGIIVGRNHAEDERTQIARCNRMFLAAALESNRVL